MRFFRNRIGRFALLVAGLLAAWALAGFVVVPRVAHDQIGKRLGAALERPVTIGAIEFNPFTLVFRVEDFHIGDPAMDAGLAGFQRLEIDASWRSLLRLAPVVSSLRLQSPQIALSRAADGRLNVQDLIDAWASPDEPDAGPKPVPRFSVTNIVIDDGRIVFDDATLQAKHEIREIALQVPFLSSLPVDEEIQVDPGLRAVVDGAHFELKGQSLPFSPARATTLQLELDDFDLTRFTGYLPTPLPVELPSARLDAALALAFSQSGDGAPSIELSGRAQIDALDVREPGGEPLLAAGSIVADDLSLAWPAKRISLGRLTVRSPRATVARRSGDRRFLEPVLAAIEGTAATTGSPQPSAPSAASSAGTVAWRIDEIVVEDGTVDLHDAAFEPRALALHMHALDAHVRDFASDETVPLRFDLALRLNHDERLTLAGSSLWHKRGLDATVGVSGFKPQDWWWIVDPLLAVEAAGGTMKLQADLRIDGAPARAEWTTPRVENVALQVDDLSLRQRPDGSPLLALPRFALAGGAIDPLRHTVALGSIEAHGGKLRLQRDRSGLNVQRLLNGPSAESARKTGEAAHALKESSAQSPVTRVGGHPGNTEKEREKEREKEEEEEEEKNSPVADWTISLKRLALDGFAIDWRDAHGSQAVELPVRSLTLRIDDFSTAARADPARVALRAGVGRRGTVSVSGKAAWAGADAQLQLAIRELQLAPLQAWLADYTEAEITSGAFNAEGSLRVAMAGRSATKAPAPSIHWRGRAGISGFSADLPGADGKWLQWQSLTFEGIDVDTSRKRADLGDIALSGLRTRIVLDAQGRLNLSGVTTGESRTAAADASVDASPGAPHAEKQSPLASASDRQLRIGSVRLADADIDFSDFFVQPNYSAHLSALGGQVSEMTASQAGKVELHGRVNQTGVLEIRGQIDPLAEPVQLDLTASVDDIDLPGLSPYSGKYVGYDIEKGTLSAQLAYRLDDRRLTAENHVVLNQLTFGKAVDSPDALKAPVLFAVSLLKDRNGVIDVNLPVSGSLDDPQFSISGIVLRIIGNLIVKTVTAPFALIAKLAGASGAELSWIGFRDGDSRLDDAATEKLETIAHALNERPGLKLDVTARTDPVADREGLRQRALQQAVDEQRRRATDDAADADERNGVRSKDAEKFDAEKYAHYLERAWKAAKFDKPRNAIGLIKKQPVAEMQRMMLEHIEVTDADLVALGSARAQQVKNWLVERGGVGGDRVFLVAPGQENGGSDEDKRPLARVDLSLK